jgi:serine/threonine protein kinase
MGTSEGTGPGPALTRLRVGGLGMPGPGPSWADDRAANSTDVKASRPDVTNASASPASTGSTNDSNWDTDARLTEVAAPLYPGSVIRDRFVLVDELGRGGMGVVYKAYDRSRGDVKDRYVAIKVLNEEFKRHPLAVRALQREARKAQRLAHPNVVSVHDFDRDGGNVYMVMELLSGRPLDQVLRDDGQGGIPLGPAMQIIKSLGAALSYAHEQDIVHCDFKPSNAFLGRDGRSRCWTLELPARLLRCWRRATQPCSTRASSEGFHRPMQVWKCSSARRPMYAMMSMRFRASLMSCSPVPIHTSVLML